MLEFKAGDLTLTQDKGLVFCRKGQRISKCVVVDDVFYPSVVSAANKLKIPEKMLYRKVSALSKGELKIGNRTYSYFLPSWKDACQLASGDKPILDRSTLITVAVPPAKPKTLAPTPIVEEEPDPPDIKEWKESTRRMKAELLSRRDVLTKELDKTNKSLALMPDV